MLTLTNNQKLKIKTKWHFPPAIWLLNMGTDVRKGPSLTAGEWLKKWQNLPLEGAGSQLDNAYQRT